MSHLCFSSQSPLHQETQSLTHTHTHTVKEAPETTQRGSAFHTLSIQWWLHVTVTMIRGDLSWVGKQTAAFRMKKVWQRWKCVRSTLRRVSRCRHLHPAPRQHLHNWCPSRLPEWCCYSNNNVCINVRVLSQVIWYHSTSVCAVFFCNISTCERLGSAAAQELRWWCQCSRGPDV